MVLSEYFTDEEIVDQLRGYFELDIQWKINFLECLSQVIELDNGNLSVKIKNRTFEIDKITGIVTEVSE